MLNIEHIRKEEYSILQLSGEVDASNSVDLDAAIQEMLSEGINRILVDGSKLEYISSAGLGVFMSYLEEFKEKDIQLVIFGLLEKVQQVFVILGLDKLIIIKPNREEALQAIV
jgi:anti-sigma B factor antagonist